MAPPLVPAMQSTGMRSCCNASSTPTCAAPRAPPPPSARQMRGLALAVASVELAAAAVAAAATNRPPAKTSAFIHPHLMLNIVIDVHGWRVAPQSSGTWLPHYHVTDRVDRQ